ncbi:glycosyltransferase [Candidatus Pelagibacter communis]|uniref:glycosyltransferase n=1 Tax=Pelagibacter ubique TaxID=198252 RepID=UPI00094D3C53|nr:glycosyltransferase [Candidatus Pelagibacter ubique]
MKTLFIIGSFFPSQKGGPDSSIYWLVKSLNEKSYSQNLVLSFFDGLSSHDIKKFKIKKNKICKIKGVNVIFFSYFIFKIFSFNYWFYLIKNLKKYNLININSYFFSISILSAIIFKIFKANYYLSLRGEIFKETLNYNKYLKITLMPILNRIYKNSKFLHCTTHQEKISAKKYLPKFNYEIFPNIINEENKFFKVNYKIRKDYLYLGRLHNKKNIDKIITAFFLAEKKIDKKIKLLIAGKGDEKYTNYLKNLTKNKNLKNKVIFLGHKNYTEKMQLMLKSKYLIFFSKSENFGNVILEAMLNRLPVIVSKNLPWKILNNIKAGYLIDYSIDALKKHIIKSSKINKNEYFRQIHNCKILLSKYSSKKNLPIIIKILKKYA